MILDSFERTFADLRIEFLTNTTAQMAIGTIRILDCVENIARDVQDISTPVLI